MRDDTFRDLHRGEMLILPNAWDAGTARLIESRGAKAIATTSAGLAWAAGYADGDFLPVELLLAATQAIARVIEVPLTIDIEGGYSDNPAEVGALATRVIEAGAVGINIEDGGGSTDLFCAKLAAVRESARRSGVELFVNARTDVYLRGLATDGDPVGETARRAGLYSAAGCDGIFVPGVSASADIKAIADAIRPAPLNVMLVPGLPSHGEMQALGVQRLSGGSAIAQASLGLVGRMADDLLAGRDGALFDGALGYGEINALFQ